MKMNTDVHASRNSEVQKEARGDYDSLTVKNNG